MKSTPKSALVSRRHFAKSALAASALLGAPAFLRGQNLNSRLNVAIIGSGGRGAASIKGCEAENLVAFCDVNELNLDKAAEKFPKARKAVDFRKLFDHAKEFDAVCVSTCEHTHALATMLALKHGKHVYCEKPLTHNIWEARQIREFAAKKKLATQMGIQMHATDNMRRVVELIHAGAVGPVHEAHVWVSRAWGLQSKEASDANKDRVYVAERPKEAMPVPAGLHWDLWLGPAPARPYHEVYFPGPKWYRWWDFGSGTMSDLGSHWNDFAFWALKLRAPLTIEAFGPPPHPEIAPASMRAVYEYGPRGEMPAVKLTWHQGEEKPEIWKNGGIPQWQNGVLFIGAKGMLLADYGKHVLLPEKNFADFKRPPQVFPKPASHHAEWIAACKGGPAALANFDYSGWLTEANHLGNVAYRVGKKLHWDAAKLRATNAPEADKLIKRVYRQGWDWPA
ncbi:MAG: Gfo/Idh/MocA family oxidoreductase [Verrucomicrobia bacterium]|nr:Gfo/Idh/MocA family oxidoreductase [Verrucomicrobiota bacterium]